MFCVLPHLVHQGAVDEFNPAGILELPGGCQATFFSERRALVGGTHGAVESGDGSEGSEARKTSSRWRLGVDVLYQRAMSSIGRNS
jgi:hypothetical protein